MRTEYGTMGRIGVDWEIGLVRVGNGGVTASFSAEMTWRKTERLVLTGTFFLQKTREKDKHKGGYLCPDLVDVTSSLRGMSAKTLVYTCVLLSSRLHLVGLLGLSVLRLAEDTGSLHLVLADECRGLESPYGSRFWELESRGGLRCSSRGGAFAITVEFDPMVTAGRAHGWMMVL